MKIIVEDSDTIMKAHGLDNEEIQEALIKQMTIEIKDKIREENNMKTINVEISNITEAQAIALEDMFRTWVSLGNNGSSRWTCFYADGDGNFRPSIKVDGKEAQYAEVITDELRKVLWDNDEYRIDFDSIAWKIRGQNGSNESIK